MEYDRNKVMMSPLKTGMIRNNFIENFKYEYGQYLCDFVNASKIRTNLGGSKFNLIFQQSKGEPDISNEVNYGIDFKLLVDKKTLENMFWYTENISVDEYGARIYSISKLKGEYRKYFLFKIFRNKSKEDIENINLKNNALLDEFDILVKHYIPKIEMNKNALYFLPYNFYYKEYKSNKGFFKYMCDQLSIDLQGFLKYRESKTDKDTYVCFISNQYIVFGKYIHRKIELYDWVKTTESKIYTELQDIVSFW